MATRTAAPRSTDDAATRGRLRTVLLARAAIALVWAALLATVGLAQPGVAIALLVGYPLIDVFASLIDAAAHRGTPAATTQRLNAGLSLAAAIAMGVAASAGQAATVLVFGVWAVVAGAIQLFLGVRRRRALGGQWPMIISGAGSIAAGTSFVLGSSNPEFALTSLATYATIGAVLFVIGGVRLGRG